MFYFFCLLIITKLRSWDKADFTPRTKCTYLQDKFAKSLAPQRFHAENKSL